MKTKILIASLIGLFATVKLSAQTDSANLPANTEKTSRFFEMGMNVYSMDLISADYYFQGDPNVLRNTFVNGLYFKFFKGKNVLRASLNYHESIVEYGEHVYPTYWNYNPSSAGVLKKGDLKVGYQRLFGSRKLSAYFFVELQYCYSQQSGSSPGYYYGNYFSSDIRYAYSPRSFLIERSQMGICKGLGLRWNVARSLVLNLETNVMYYYYLQQEIKNSTYKQRGVGLNFSPVQFSLGFKF